MLLGMDSSAPELAELLKLVCKTFWSATYMAIPAILNQEAQFAGWMACLHALMVKPLPLVRPRGVDCRWCSAAAVPLGAGRRCWSIGRQHSC